MTTVTKNSLADLEDRVSQWGDDWSDARYAANAVFRWLRLYDKAVEEGNNKNIRHSEINAAWWCGTLHERLAGAPRTMMDVSLFLANAVSAGSGWDRGEGWKVEVGE